MKTLKVHLWIYRTLTLKAISVQQVFTLLMTLYTALSASHSLSCYSPQKTLTFVAVRRRCCRP